MTPQEQIMERICDLELLDGAVRDSRYHFSPEKLAKVLVEMEEKIDRKIEMGPPDGIQMAQPMMASGVPTPNYSTVTLQDPYLTALDDVWESLYTEVGPRSCEPYDNYFRAWNQRTDEIRNKIDDLRNKHKE